MTTTEEELCFFAEKVPQVSCNNERIKLELLLERSSKTPADCQSELEHLLLLAGWYDLQPTKLHNQNICTNHRNTLLEWWRRKHNCLLCVDLFEKKKRATTSLQRITKAVAWAVWSKKHLNIYNSWACTQCRKTCTNDFGCMDHNKTPFEWLYDVVAFQTPSIAGSLSYQHDLDYEPLENDVSSYQEEDEKIGLKEWLASTNYHGRCRSTNKYSSLGRHDQTAFRRQMKGIFHHILQQFAQDDADEVWDDIISDEMKKPDTIRSGNYDTMIASLKDAYSRAEHWSTKRQLLSIVAADLPTHLLKAEFPELTDWKIKAARAQAYFHGRGVLPETARNPVQRYTEKQLSHFIAFIQSPHITTDMPFGERRIKLSNGKSIIVPDVIRNIIPSRIIAQYFAYCKETDDEEDFKPLSESTLFAVLGKCGAVVRKSLAGLDSFSCDGSTAFDNLRNLCDDMATYGTEPEIIVRLKQDLSEGRNYLKLDYRTHVSRNSRISDHCSVFGLSDVSNKAWRQKCDHAHDEEYVNESTLRLNSSCRGFRCDSCLRLRETFSHLSSIIEENSNIAKNMRDRFRYRLEQNIQLIVEWKKHLLRTVHQDIARKHILDQLDEKSVFLVADWAMKWLPTRYREAQRDFFGKRGLPWHITYAIRLKRASSPSSSSGHNKVFEHRTFCHVFDNTKQDGSAVSSILCDVLKQLKQNDNNLSTAYIRTDNAGCYKGSDTLLSVEKIYRLTGVLISRFDFSDAQSGKGSCDRMAAVTKGNIHRFINEKNDCVTSSDFARAAKSTRYMSVMACRLTPSSTKHKTRWPGIQNYNNIQYELVSKRVLRRADAENEIRVTVWRAFDIGVGQSFSWSKLNVSGDNIIPIETSTRYDNCKWQEDSFDKGNHFLSMTVLNERVHVSTLVCNIESPDNDNVNSDIPADQNIRNIDNSVGTNQHPSLFVTFDCTEPHCVMTFRREDRLRAHLLIDSHTIIAPPFRLLDKAAMVYKDALDSETPKEIPILSANSSTVTNSTVSATSLEEGWALFRSREKVTFSPIQRSYLNEKYLEGERSGAKWDPSKLAEHMQMAKKHGRFLFEPEQFLTSSQIKSYFSRMTRERRKNANDIETVDSREEILENDEDFQSEDDEDKDDFDAIVRTAEAHQLLDNAIRVLDDVLLHQSN